MINVKSALDAWWKLASIFSGGMLGLILLGYFAPKVKSRGAVAGVIAGVIVIGWMSLTPVFIEEGAMLKFVSPFHNYLSIVFGTMALVIVGFLLGILSGKKRNKEQ
jgi:SSS family solute:Na+ symporter